MKNQNNIKKESHFARLNFSRIVKRLTISAFLLGSLYIPLQAQETENTSDSLEVRYTKPTWWFGGAIGANFNFYEGTTQRLNAGLMAPTAFRYGKGIGLFLAPLIEYHKPDSRFGAMLQIGYDSRRGDFDQVESPCNCPEDLSTGLSYLTIEPSLRFAPFKSNLYIYGGPRLAFNLDKSFKYQLGLNPNVPGQAATPAVEGDFSDIDKMLISMQIGAGYDIPLTSQKKKTQFVLSPFVSFQPYFGASPRSTETWTLTTIRAGISIKFGQGDKIKPAEKEILPVVVLPEVNFYVESPKNIPVDRRVRETFPIRNYVFFNLGSTEIPSRYVMLRKDQVKDFKEDRLEVFTPKELSGAAKRQMVVYYNLINILGDRMSKNPSTTITLVGSSEKGQKDGIAMSESIKRYLVDIFEIKESRIGVVGQTKSEISSEQPGATKELDVLREEDRRVSIETDSQVLKMEYQTGNDVPLKPVVLTVVQEAPVDSYVVFNVEGAKANYSSWSLEVKSNQNVIQHFGPYTKEKIAIPGKNILGTNEKGDFSVKMIGQTYSGKTEIKKDSVHMVLWKLPVDEQGMRFSVIFGFNNSESIATYEKYLTNVVTPKIPDSSIVIIHGHTDTIGNEEHNIRLSLARANNVLKILKKAMKEAGRNDVTYKVFGFGEDNNISPFSNTLPEGRFYNRTVTIDIILKK